MIVKSQTNHETEIIDPAQVNPSNFTEKLTKRKIEHEKFCLRRLNAWFHAQSDVFYSE